MFPTESPNLLETTPVVVDGVMYVTFANTVHALDAYHGREIWSHSQPRTPKILGASARAANRGVAVLGDRVFVVTDHAHLLALDRLTGRKLWDVEMADHRQNYNATAAPLVINNMVISGIAGGDQGVRGFLAAYDAATGERLWRFWTIPLPGEPLSETWVGDALPHGCGTTWLTGTYDPDLDLLYWTTGNPCPDYNGDERLGDNLYTNSILALRPDSGELAWYYQYTPHDEHDWDSIQTPMLVDRDWEGAPRKLLVQANRNGFFYVLDREDGELLLAKPFIDKLTWASGIGEDGRPILIPGKRPTPEGNIVCPGLQGAANWPAVSYNPDTGLFYVMAAEFCLSSRNATKNGRRVRPTTAALERASQAIPKGVTCGRSTSQPAKKSGRSTPAIPAGTTTSPASPRPPADSCSLETTLEPLSQPAPRTAKCSGAATSMRDLAPAR